MAKAKEIIGLDCDANAIEGIRLVLLTRFDEMCAFREAALDFADIEGVHDMRVASRRLRSTLRDFLPFLKKDSLKDFKDELKKIADALGNVRDEDVAIKSLEDLEEEVGKSERDVRKGIENFIEERKAVREKARSVLEETITAETFLRLREELNKALEKAVSNENPEPNNFREAGSAIINELLKDFMKLSEHLYTPFRVKKLHKLRIAAKRLRYAMELFTVCFDEKIKSFAKEISEMQDSLGELHNCDDWINDLSKQLTEFENENERHAAVWLLSYFVKIRTKHYSDALERWNEWQQNDFVEKVNAALQND